MTHEQRAKDTAMQIAGGSVPGARLLYREATIVLFGTARNPTTDTETADLEDMMRELGRPFP